MSILMSLMILAIGYSHYNRRETDSLGVPHARNCSEKVNTCKKISLKRVNVNTEGENRYLFSENAPYTLDLYFTIMVFLNKIKLFVPGKKNFPTRVCIHSLPGGSGENVHTSKLGIDEWP